MMQGATVVVATGKHVKENNVESAISKAKRNKVRIMSPTNAPLSPSGSAIGYVSPSRSMTSPSSNKEPRSESSAPKDLDVPSLATSAAEGEEIEQRDSFELSPREAKPIPQKKPGSAISRFARKYETEGITLPVFKKKEPEPKPSPFAWMSGSKNEVEEDEESFVEDDQVEPVSQGCVSEKTLQDVKENMEIVMLGATVMCGRGQEQYDDRDYYDDEAPATTPATPPLVAVQRVSTESAQMQTSQPSSVQAPTTNETSGIAVPSQHPASEPGLSKEDTKPGVTVSDTAEPFPETAVCPPPQASPSNGTTVAANEPAAVVPHPNEVSLGDTENGEAVPKPSVDADISFIGTVDEGESGVDNAASKDEQESIVSSTENITDDAPTKTDVLAANPETVVPEVIIEDVAHPEVTVDEMLITEPAVEETKAHESLPERRSDEVEAIVADDQCLTTEVAPASEATSEATCEEPLEATAVTDEVAEPNGEPAPMSVEVTASQSTAPLVKDGVPPAPMESMADMSGCNSDTIISNAEDSIRFMAFQSQRFVDSCAPLPSTKMEVPMTTKSILDDLAADEAGEESAAVEGTTSKAQAAPTIIPETASPAKSAAPTDAIENTNVLEVTVPQETATDYHKETTTQTEDAVAEPTPEGALAQPLVTEESTEDLEAVIIETSPEHVEPKGESTEEFFEAQSNLDEEDHDTHAMTETLVEATTEVADQVAPEAVAATTGTESNTVEAVVDEAILDEAVVDESATSDNQTGQETEAELEESMIDQGAIATTNAEPVDETTPEVASAPEGATAADEMTEGETVPEDPPTNVEIVSDETPVPEVDITEKPVPEKIVEESAVADKITVETAKTEPQLKPTPEPVMEEIPLREVPVEVKALPSRHYEATQEETLSFFEQIEENVGLVMLGARACFCPTTIYDVGVYDDDDILEEKKEEVVG